MRYVDGAENARLKMTGKMRRYIYKELVIGTNRYYTICEALRMVYDLVDDLPDEELKKRITDRLIDVFMMGKKMTDRLRYYKDKYKDSTGHGGKNLIYILGSKKRTEMRHQRKI